MADEATTGGDVGGGAPMGPPNLFVTPESLQTYADDIDADLENNVRPLLERFRAAVLAQRDGYSGGPAFITSEKYEFAARINLEHYSNAAKMYERLKKVVQGMEILSDAARRMAADYVTADEQSRIHYIDANRYLGDAYEANEAAHANDPKDTLA